MSRGERPREHQRCFEGPLDLANVSNLERQQLPSPLVGGGFGRLPMREVARVPEDRHLRRTWDELLEQLESLSGQLCPLKAQAREVPARASENQHLVLDRPLARLIDGPRAFVEFVSSATRH